MVGPAGRGCGLDSADYSLPVIPQTGDPRWLQGSQGCGCDTSGHSQSGPHGGVHRTGECVMETGHEKVSSF